MDGWVVWLRLGSFSCYWRQNLPSRKTRGCFRLEERLELAPFDLNIRLSLIDAHIRSGRYENAGVEVGRAKALSPGNAKVSLAESNLWIAQKKTPEGLAILDSILDSDPTDFKVRFRRAQVHYAEKNFGLALKDLKILNVQSPTDLNVIEALGQAYTKDAALSAAETVLKK